MLSHPPAQTPLLMRQNYTGKLLVNFDPQIFQAFYETRCFLNVGMEVPKMAVSLLHMEGTFKTTQSSLEVWQTDGL